jgi:hypothetical protein
VTIRVQSWDWAQAPQCLYVPAIGQDRLRDVPGSSTLEFCHLPSAMGPCPKFLLLKHLADTHFVCIWPCLSLSVGPPILLWNVCTHFALLDVECRLLGSRKRSSLCQESPTFPLSACGQSTQKSQFPVGIIDWKASHLVTHQRLMQPLRLQPTMGPFKLAGTLL